jgi:hypothetical protein
MPKRSTLNGRSIDRRSFHERWLSMDLEKSEIVIDLKKAWTTAQ